MSETEIKKSLGFARRRNFAIAGIVISTVVLLFALWNSIPSLKAKKTLLSTQKILSAGRLDSLPVSTTELEVSGWGGFTTGEDYIKFRATPEDINKFITMSQSIKGVTPEIFNSEHMYLPYIKDVEKNMDSENYFKHNYYYEHQGAPAWYKPTITKNGRMYKIPGDPNMRGHNWGSVIVNDETNTVYIWVIWS